MFRMTSLLFRKFTWAIPVFFMLLGTIYFINLFDRMYTRDLIRQSEEKYQLINVIERLETKKNVLSALAVMDNFSDTHTYLLDKSLNRVIEKMHTANCPFRFTQHPYEIEEFKKQILSHVRGSFIYRPCNSGPMYLDYRWVELEGVSYLIMTGVSNYPNDAIDKELQIAVGSLLLLTALMNWILVGYAKYLHQYHKRIVSRDEK